MRISIMRAHRLGWLGFLAALGGCALVVGCQGTRPGMTTMSSSREASPRLNAAQKADLHFAFARSLEKTATAEQAMEAYQELIKRDPQCSEALDRLAVLNAKKGNFEQAVSLHKKALQLQPRNADFACNLGYCYYLQRRWADAETQFRKAIDSAPEHRRAHNNLGLVLAHGNRTKEALAAFRHAGCSDADAHNNLAFILTLENSWQEAREHYARAHELDPSLAPAEKGLRIINARMENVEKPTAPAIKPVSDERAPIVFSPMPKPRPPVPPQEIVEITPIPVTPPAPKPPTRASENWTSATSQVVTIPPPAPAKTIEFTPTMTPIATTPLPTPAKTTELPRPTAPILLEPVPVVTEHIHGITPVTDPRGTPTPPAAPTPKVVERVPTPPIAANTTTAPAPRTPTVAPAPFEQVIGITRIPASPAATNNR
jgi:Flp pilus assembly protein TadD